MKRLHALLPLFCIVLAGCAAVNMHDSKKISKNAGILITRVTADCTGCKMPIINKENWAVSSAIFNAGGNKWHVIALPAGDYSWRGLYFGADAAEFRGKMTFRIEPGKINYIGDLLVQSEANDNTGARVHGVFRITVINNAQKAVQELKAAYPDLYARYLFVVGLTQDRRSSEEVYITGP